MVREAGWRAVQMRHFDVQLIGGMVLHQGKIAEMKTGEGKTLVATLACYLNALAGHGVHVVTVNDYLAKRDAEWMGKIYEFLGLTVGVIVHDLDDNQRRAAYAADITYGTNNEFGFDYLRDNMKFEIKDCVQRGHYYAIVDEVDSILIDEARTPLIISGPTDQTTDKYARVRKIIPQLEQGEEVEWTDTRRQEELGIRLAKARSTSPATTSSTRSSAPSASPTRAGRRSRRLLGIGNIADAENWELKHYVETGIKAHALYKRDVDYVVKDGEVIIVDTFTGRLMPGRRWSDGLHQSIEAKEGVNIRKEDQTLATITFQNYFRLYQEAERHDRHGRNRGRRVREDLQARDRRHSHQQAACCGSRIPTSSSAPRRKSTRPSPTTSPSCTRRSSRCWSAPRRSRSRSGSPRSCSARACATWC